MRPGTKIKKIIPILKKQSGVTTLKGIGGDPFKTLFSTIISQRLRDETTERVSRDLFKKYPNVRKLADARLKDLYVVLKSSGFYRVKAKRIKETAKMICDDFNCKVPNDFSKLCSLPGVGRKTANCVLVYAFQKPRIPVDTHVHRVSNRLGLVKTRNPDNTELELMKITPEKYWLYVNELFVIFGKTVCKPINPQCKECPILKYCVYGTS